MNSPATETAAPSSAAGNLTYVLLAVVVIVTAIFAISTNALPDHWYALFKSVHVILAVVWVGGGVLLTVLALRAQRESDPRAVVTVAQQAAFAGEKIFAPAGLIVFLMGIAMMINTDWGWGEFWVIVGLIGYAATFITGLTVLSPLAKKVKASAEENGPEHPTTLALIDRILLIARIDVAVLLLVIADMVTKPFS
jgi:uncharacterized membrane protein